MIISEKERMQELVFVFSDADKRSTMTPEELEHCPTLQEALEAMAE